MKTTDNEQFELVSADSLTVEERALQASALTAFAEEKSLDASRLTVRPFRLNGELHFDFLTTSLGCIRRSVGTTAGEVRLDLLPLGGT